MSPTLRVLNRLGIISLAAVCLAGCFTGERPSFNDAAETAPIVATGNQAIDDVLGLLDSVDGAQLSAGYAIETKFNSVSSTGRVVQASGRRTSVTIENDERAVRFILEGPERRTCDLLEGVCEPTLNNARISDTQLPYDFYAPAFAARLRADANRRIDDPVAYDDTIGGQAATCVDVAVTGGVKTYCALDNGLLARFVGADVTIELSSYSPEPDLTAFESSR
jgi:hypothetical protein